MNDLNQSAEQSYQVDVQLQDPVIRDYCVFEQPTLPFSCLLDLILRIALSRDAKLNEDQTELVINHLHYIRPIVFRGSQKHHLRVVFQPMESEARITKTRITVASAEAAQGSEDQGHWQIYLHCQLETKKLAMEGPARSPLPQSLLRDLDSHKPSDVWPHRIAELQELGLQLGEFYQGQGALWRTEEWLVTRWQLSSLAAGYGHSFLLHPAWLTAALLMPLGEAAMGRRGIPLVSEVASCRVWRSTMRQYRCPGRKTASICCCCRLMVNWWHRWGGVLCLGCRMGLISWADRGRRRWGLALIAHLTRWGLAGLGRSPSPRRIRCCEIIGCDRSGWFRGAIS